MPSTIPYDPSLVLANVVTGDALKVVEQISAAQAPVDAAQENLNALLTSRRSLDMTKTELGNLGINTDDIDAAVQILNTEISTQAKDYTLAKIKAEKEIQGLRGSIRTVNKSVESPVDYVKTEIKSLPLAADSMSMDVQYFSLDKNDEEGATFSKAISSFVSASTAFLGTSVQHQASAAASKQASHQAQSQKIVGTLVLSVSCTHKNASVLAPFVLNVDKGVKVWNHLNPKDQLEPTDYGKMAALANKGDLDGPKFSILSGMTFGSSFVGMVHVLNTIDTSVTESLSSIASSLQRQMDAGAWFESASGGFGVNATIGNNVKSLLSSQNITSHVTLICMGLIPSIVASDVQLAVEKFAKFDPESSMQAIATIQNATIANQDSVKSAADSARTGQQLIALKNGEIKGALSALAETDDGKNKVLDINSLMTALDDYLKKAADGKAGVPINYYLKDITKSMLAEMWVAKYFPGKYLAIQGDDSAAASGSGEINGGEGQKKADKTGTQTNGGNTESNGQDKS